MQAAMFSQFGPVDGPNVMEVPDLKPGTDVAIVRVQAALINPSDEEYRPFSSKATWCDARSRGSERSKTVTS